MSSKRLASKCKAPSTRFIRASTKKQRKLILPESDAEEEVVAKARATTIVKEEKEIKDDNAPLITWMIKRKAPLVQHQGTNPSNLVVLSIFPRGTSYHSDIIPCDLFCHSFTVIPPENAYPKQCVGNRGLGRTAHIIDHCKLILKYLEDTNSTWYNVQFKKFEPLEYNYDVCETILLWEQYQNMTTMLTREYLDAFLNGWVDYALLRIVQLGTKRCTNMTLYEENLNKLLLVKPLFHPHQFFTCAIVGNFGDLLKIEFRKEIDSHDVVFRDNEALVNEKYAKYVGLKRDFHLVVRGATCNMVPILNGSDDEINVK
ncbi:Sialyltransferase-like protein 1, partial [Mucuna pruriens]